MARFEIFCNTSGVSVGEYDAPHVDAALDAMVADELNGEHGWQSYVLDNHGDDCVSIHERVAVLAAWRNDYEVVEIG